MVLISRSAVEHDTSIELDANDGKLVGTQKHAGHGIELIRSAGSCVERPRTEGLDRAGKLIDGKDLSSWTPIGDTANSHWVVPGPAISSTKIMVPT